jgi:hypothetical protein
MLLVFFIILDIPYDQCNETVPPVKIIHFLTHNKSLSNFQMSNQI